MNRKKRTRSSCDKDEMAFAREIYTCVYESVATDMILTGKIDLETQSDQEITEIVQNEIHRIIKNQDLEFIIEVDHTSTLLKSARREIKQDNQDLSAFFYATFFEHTLNKLIVDASRRKKFSKKTSNHLLKATIHDKCSWVLEVLSLAPLSKLQVKRIQEIAEIRNRYVHYKWNEQGEKIEKDKQLYLNEAEKVVTYLRKYSNKAIYKGRMHKIYKNKHIFTSKS